MDSINQTIPIKITIISPVHIGSGKSLDPSLETTRKEREVNFLSLDRILEKIAANKRQLYEISRKIEGRSSEPICKIIPEKILRESTIYTLADHTTSRSREIKTFLKDSKNRPLLPGTSLKGAIRTLIFTAYLKEHDKILETLRKNPKRTRPEEAVFGRDAQKDPMKIVKTEDIYFETRNLSLKTVKMFDISNSGERCGFKIMGKNGRLAKIKEATAINVEAINPGTTFKSRIQLEEYFLKKINEILHNKVDKDRYKVDKDWYRKLFSDFFGILSDSSKYETGKYIESELKFLKKFDSRCDIRKIIEFYEKLKSEVKNSKNTIYTQIAWGIGWKGMTGNAYQNNDVLKAIFSIKHSPNKRNVRPDLFPKTRRFFTEQDEFSEFAAYPAGWLKIEKG